MSQQRRQSEQGFTIVELMIATAVLATLLVVVAVVMIGIGRLYYKGVTQMRVQNTARTVVDQITQQLQLVDDQAPVRPLVSNEETVATNFTISAFCVGKTRYSYILNRQIGTASNQIKHVLWRDKTPAGGCVPAKLTEDNPSDPSNPVTDGVELMGPKSRLTAFSISLTSPYTIAVGIAYGDDDVVNLKGPNTNGTTYPLDLSGLQSNCKNEGGEFCATASLQTTVVKRLSSLD